MVAYYACDITEDWKGSSGSGYLNQIVNLRDEFFVSIEKWIMLKGNIQVYLKSCLNMTWYNGKGRLQNKKNLVLGKLSLKGEGAVWPGRPVFP